MNTKTPVQRAKIVKVRDDMMIVFLSVPNSLHYNQGFIYNAKEFQAWMLMNIGSTEHDNLRLKIQNGMGFGDHVEVRLP